MITLRRRRQVADLAGLAMLVAAVGAVSLALPSADHPPHQEAGHAGIASSAGADQPARGNAGTTRAQTRADAGAGTTVVSHDGSQVGSTGSTGNRGGVSALVSAAAVYSTSALPTNSYLEDDTAVLLPATATVAGSSASALGLDGGSLPLQDTLGQHLFGGATRTTYAYSQAGVLTGLAKYTSIPNQLTALAYAPGSPVTRTSSLATTTPPATLDAVGAHAEALGNPATMCSAKTPFVDSDADGASTTLLDMTGAPFPPPLAGPTFSIDGAFGASTGLAVAPATQADGHLAQPVTRGVVAHAVVTLPEIVLFAGSPEQIDIDVTTPIELTVAAGGVPGTAWARVTPVLTGRRVAVRVTVGHATLQLSSSELGRANRANSNDRLRIPIGDRGQLVLGPTNVTAASDGTSVAVSSDVAELDLFGDAVEPAHVLGGLPAGWTRRLRPLTNALQNVYGKLRPAMVGTTGTPDGIAEQLRIGHLEATIAVPHGGVTC